MRKDRCWHGCNRLHPNGAPEARRAARAWRVLSPWRVVLLALHPLLCPGLRAVVRRCSQGHPERTATRDASASAAAAHTVASQLQPWAARWSPSSQKVTQQWQRKFEGRLVVVECVWVWGYVGFFVLLDLFGRSLSFHSFFNFSFLVFSF